MTLIGSKGRILLHLNNFQGYLHKMEVPHPVTQPGIADAVGLSRGHLTQVINTMRDDGLVVEEVRHVKGSVRRRKVYFLSSKGLRKVEGIRSELKEEKVMLKTFEGTREILLRDIDDHMDETNPMLEAIKIIDSNGVIDLTYGKPQEDIFVGREKELEKLKNIISDVKEGDSSTVFISGEAGIGKTRIANELGEHAKENGFQFISGKAHFETSEPYLPFKRAFRKHFERMDEMPNFGFQIGMVGLKKAKVDDRVTFDARRKASFFEAAKQLKLLAEKRPVLLFLDDMQWADKASLQLLYYLALNLDDTPVCLLVAYRPEDLHSDHFLKEVRERFMREHRSTFIDLKPLGLSLTRKMAEGMLNRDDVPPEFIELLYGMTDGNPLYITESVKRLMDEGTIDPKKNKYPLNETEFQIPRMIQGVIKRKIDSLPSEAAKLIHIGSVIGDEIPFDLILHTSQLDELDILDHIDVLLGSNLWTEHPDGERFLFTHRSVQLTAYRDISGMKRKRLHRHVASKILEVYGDRSETHYPALAYHYERSGAFEDAVEYYMKAGNFAERVYAHEDAIEMYKQVLELLDKKSIPVDRSDILEQMGDIYRVLGDYDKSRHHYLKCMESSRSDEINSRLNRKIADAWLSQGDFEKTHEFIERGLSCADQRSRERCKLLNIKGWAIMQEGKNEEAKQVFVEGKELAEEIGSLKCLGEALHTLGTVYIRTGDYHEGERYLRRAADIREEADDEEGLARTLNNIGIIYEDWGELDKALDSYEKSLEIQEKIGMKEAIATVYVNMGIIQGIRGKNEEAEEFFEKGLDMFRRIGDKRGIALGLSNLGKLHIQKGMIERALALNKECLKVSEDIGFKRAIAMSLNHIGESYHLLGDLESAKKHYEKSKDICCEMGDKRGKASAIGNIGDIHMEEGDLSEALEEYDHCINIYKDVGDLFETIHNEIRKAEAYYESGDHKNAMEHADRALSLAHTRKNRLSQAEAHLISGKIKKVLGDLDGARSDLDESESIFKSINNRPDLNVARYEIALLKREEGHEKSALDILRSVRENFKEMGMAMWVERCDAELE